MRPELANVRVPESLSTHDDRARYCRNQAAELLREAHAQPEENAKFELLNLAQQWLTLAFRYR
jgi:hypothetical protein